MVIATVLAGLFGFTTIVLLWLLYHVENGRQQLDKIVSALQRDIAGLRDRMQDKDRLLRESQDAREREEQRYVDRAMQYEKIIGDLHQQNRDFAETVAALRKEGMEGEKEVFVPDAEPVKPYSPDLRQFVSGIESAEARQWVDEFITVRREHGLDDEQILEQLEQEGTV